MKTIGIKLADGSFYPVLQDNTPSKKDLDLTTAHNNQTKVMVDLYRSASCTMEDAEYVDSLQIENLVAHPNGEADISFSVSLDENNELSAKIVDSETGKQSKTTITLVSRTQEERLITDEYDIKESKSEKKDSSNLKKAVAGGGLLAAAVALREKEDRTEVEFTPAADMEIEETSAVEEEAEIVEPEIETEPVIDEASFEAPEISETSIDETVLEEKLPETEESNFDLDLPDFPEESEETEVTPSDDFAASEPEAETPEFSMDIPDETIEEPKFEMTENNLDSSIDMENMDKVESDESSDFSLDLPDFPEEPTENSNENDPFALPEDKLAETVKEFPTFEEESIEESSMDESLSLIEENNADSFSLDDMDDFSTDTISDTSFDDTFDIPDVPTEDEVSTNNNDLPDDFFDMEETKSFNDDVPAGKGLSFTGLYDKETELGTASYDEEDTKKKTKVPVIICIVCAIICILATAAVLFIIPSKYNLLKKADNSSINSDTTKVEKVEKVEEVAEVTPVPEPVVEPEPVPEAKEEEIVIIEKAEEVVPEQPPVAEEKPKDITYKIKWGDTLWDISETYYKNPWRYKYIARFNKIRNPDYIISGTYITIPAE